MDKHSFHVVLANGSERDITADDVHVTDAGVLTFVGHTSDVLVAYAANAWTMVEVERKDDKD